MSRLLELQGDAVREVAATAKAMGTQAAQYAHARQQQQQQQQNGRNGQQRNGYRARGAAASDPVVLLSDLAAGGSGRGGAQEG